MIKVETTNLPELTPNLTQWIYNGLDTMLTSELTEKLTEELNPTTERTYKFSLALQAPIMEMTVRGIKVDRTQLKRTLKQVEQAIAKLEDCFTRLCLEGIGLDRAPNWRSPSQLKYFFFQVLKAKEVKKMNTAGGFSASTDRAALERIGKESYYSRIPSNIILALRDLDKQRQFLSTKLDSDGRLRSNWNIAGTKTGRLFSSVSDFRTGTNNQNIDRALRSVFIPDKGMKFANLDLEQADARGVGAVCWNIGKEPGNVPVDYRVIEHCGAYLDACEAGDLHTQVCKMVWRELDWPNEPKADRALADQPFYREFSYRDCAKRVGHGCNYMGLANIAKATGIEKSKLADFRDRYFSAFPTIPFWHDWVRYTLKTTGQITTLMGRRRCFFGRLNDENVLREAVAYEPQSITADTVNTGMLHLWRAELGVHILAQVHDSILLQYPEVDEDWILPEIIDLMTVAAPLKHGRSFTIPVEAKVGWNWGDASENNPRGLRKYERSEPSNKLESSPTG